jgi:hypothetical protein
MSIMQIEDKNVKAVIAVAWVLTWSVVAVSLNVNSVSSWMLLVGAGTLPPLMLLKLWHEPAQTISESIHEVVK